MSNLPQKKPRVGGPAHGLYEPFREGNQAALRHGLYATKFQMLRDKQEIAEKAELLRSLIPVYSVHFEPALQLLSAQLDQLEDAYRYASETPVAERTKSFWEGVGALENRIWRGFRDLALTPVAASELGLNLSRLAASSEDSRPPFDWGALDAGERRELERLLAKGRRSDAL